MTNSTVSDLQGRCITPFLDASQFGHGGFTAGRFCAPVYELPGIPICCLPCPATDWAYSDSFVTYTKVAGWLNVAGLILLVFMLVTYVVLPTQQTRSHYLSVCLIGSIAMVALGFIIPLADDPNQCYDEITPNDMHSSIECAWSGALLIAGGQSAVMWIFIRALSMHLQICWDIVPGKKFFYVSQFAGWGVPAALLSVTITITGVSFRFGPACLVNHKNSLADFWGPLLALAGAAGIVQLITFSYCIHIFFRNLWSDGSGPSTDRSARALPSYTNSVRRPRAVYRRLKKVLWLQWRGLVIVTLILVDVVFFSIVFVYLDGMQNNIVTDASKWVRVKPWLQCLVQANGDKEQCLHLVRGWLINEATITSVLFLLSLAGVQVFLLLMRPSIFLTWWNFIRSKFSSPNEFVSFDAKPNVMRSTSKLELLGGRQRQNSIAAIEMQSKPYVATSEVELKGFTSIISSPNESYKSPLQGGYESPSVDGPYDSNITQSPLQLARSRLPPEYVRSAITPSPLHDTPPGPGFAYNRAHAARQGTDYFAQNQFASSDDDRPFFPSQGSFSTPNAPSREGSIGSVDLDPRDLYTRGGLALNPPSEAGQSRDDISSPERIYFTSRRR